MNRARSSFVPRWAHSIVPRVLGFLLGFGVLGLALGFGEEWPAQRKFTTASGSKAFRDVTAQVQIRFAAMRWNRSLGVWQTELSVRNLGATALSGRLVVAAVDLRGTGGMVDPDNPPAAPSDEPRFWELAAPRAGASLDPGTATDPRTVSWSRLGNQAPSVVVRVYVEAGGPGVVEPLAFTRTLDGDGLPRPGVSVIQLAPAGMAPRASDPAAGAISLGGKPGSYIWRFESPGHLPVWRSAQLGELPVTKLPAPRLTRRSGRSWGAESGTLEITNALRLSRRASGAVTTGVRVEPTLLTAQSLPFPLPLGWSVQRAFWIEAQGPWPAEMQIEARTEDAFPEGGSVVWLARFHESNLTWRVVARGVARGSDWLPCAVREPGAYVVVSADSPSPSGAEPAVGSALEARAPSLAGVEGLSAAGRVLPGVSVASTNRLEVQARAELWISNRLGSVPSGALIRARIRESHRLADGSRRELTPYEVALFVRRPLGESDAGQAVASFLLQPQLLVGAEDLDETRVSAEILPEGAFEGGVLGGSYGALQRDGLVVAAAAGASTSPQAVELRVVPAGVATALALQDLVRWPTRSSDATARPPYDLIATLEIATDSPLSLRFDPPPSDGSYVLARAWYRGAQAGLEPVALWEVRNGMLRERAGDASASSAAVDRSGQWVVVHLSDDAGFVTGTVRDAQGESVSQAFVQVAGTPWSTITDDQGRYRLVAAAGRANLRLADAGTGEWSTHSTVVPAGLPPTLFDLSTTRTAPFVFEVSPPPGSSNVSVLAPVVLRFSRALQPPAAGRGLELRDAHSNAVPSRTEWEQGGRVARLIPTGELAAATRHTVQLAPTLVDAAGTPLIGDREFTFTTVARDFVRASGAQLTSEAPDAQGQALVRGSPGMGLPRQPVLFVNETSGQTATGIAAPDGSFSQRLDAAASDLLAVVVIHPDGTRTRYPVGRQLFPDGSVALFSEGGRLTNRHESLEVVLEVPPGAIQGRTRFKLTPIPTAELSQATRGTPPEHGTLMGGFDFDVEGDPVQGKVRFEVKPDLSRLTPPPGKTVQEMTLIAGAFRELTESSDGVERVVPVYEYMDLLRRDTSASRSLASAQVRPQLLSIGFYAFGNPTDARVMLFGNVYYSQTEILGQTTSALFFGGADAVPDSDIPVGGAVIRARAKSALNSRPFTLQGGELVATSAPDGSFAFLVPEQTADHSGHALNATHPSFPRQFATSGAGMRFDPIHPFGGGKIRFNRQGAPDTTPPSITVLHAPEAPGTDQTVLVRVEAVDESGPSTPSLVVESVDPASAVVTLTPGSPGLWELRSMGRAKVVLRARAVDPFSNAGETVHLVRFGDAPAPPAPAHDPLGPRVLYSQPDEGGVGVDTLGVVRLRFSEWVDPDLLVHPSDYLTLSPPGGAVDAEFVGDPNEVSLRFTQLRSNTEYTLHLQGLRDLTGQYLDQDPGTRAPTNEPFVLRFRTAPEVLGALQPVSEGGGVVVRGAYAYLIDRAGQSLTRFDISIPARPIDSGTRSLPGPPRGLALVRDYEHTMGFANSAAPGPLPGARATNDFLVVAGHLTGSKFGYVRVFNLAQPFPASTHVASALVTMDETA
ncbi:MAG: Ig-like domain-containing protein, partial [Verrucomicrobiales bacterium]|nr:Ig-like domain-containing protein [Verrucomicrobiales bacterium]